MKSSSIALKYVGANKEKYLINLVDTPGHVDFCGEVSAAVRLCDGALIVVDVVEGICPQTKVALEQAWKEDIKPILILNKIDRLVLEQKLDETAAHLRLNQLLEQVNAIVATLLTTELFEGEALLSQRFKCESALSRNDDEEDKEQEHLQVYDWANAIEDVDDDKYYFMPEKDNVIFASSIDDWAFTVGSFAKILSQKHKINLTALRKTLWGDFYIDMKQRKILKNAQAKAKKPLFVSMVLENIWKVYDTVCVRRDKIKLERVCQVLEISLSPRDINHTDSRYQTKLIMSKWLQLANNVLDSVIKIIPSPCSLSEKRVERLLSSNLKKFYQLPDETKKLKDSFLRCSPDDTVKVACISKMVAIEKKYLQSRKINLNIANKPSQTQTIQATPTIACQAETDDSIVFIAFARIFSGSMRRGDKLYVLGPRHDPSHVSSESASAVDEKKVLDELGTNEHVTIATIEDFYLLMGRELEKIDEARAGNIVGISGLDKHLVRTATLSNNLFCPPFNDLHLPATPILRVAIEPKNPLEMPILVSGLKLLNQADPCVEVKLQETGEHVIIATGEVHLQHCIKDLKERYANDIELNISQPIVSFRETVVLPPKTDMVNETIDDNNRVDSITSRKNFIKHGIIELLTPNKRCRIKIKCSPLPESVIECLMSNGEPLRIIGKLVTSRQKSSQKLVNQLSDHNQKKVEEFKKKLQDNFDSSRKDRSEWRLLYPENSVERIWSFGPKYIGPNLLVASSDINCQYNQWRRIYNQDWNNDAKLLDLGDYIDSFISGFQLATQSGPLCEEPMMGVCFTVIEWSSSCTNSIVTHDNELLDDRLSDCDRYSEAESGSASMLKDNYGPMSGQIISTVKECCRKSFQAQPQRLMSPMFSCEIQVTTDVLGKMYAVLGRRNGRILHGDMREGSQTFEIKAFIPVIESLDFVNEIRKQTSGMANPQLIFSHYEVIDVDPFWTPNSEEEYALYGEKADTENQARKYMNLVRKRKGLSVQEKIVEHGEKQRTIKRNK